jgi:hypothetical protein
MKETTSLTASTLVAGAAKSTSKTLIHQLNPLEIAREYVRWRVVAEEQRTERKRIKARRDVAVRAIESEREIISSYFEKCFAERRMVLEEIFRLLRHAVESKNDAALDSALRAIVQVVADNPLKDFDAFRKARHEGVVLEF